MHFVLDASLKKDKGFQTSRFVREQHMEAANDTFVYHIYLCIIIIIECFSTSPHCKVKLLHN